MLGCLFEYLEPYQIGNGGSEATAYWKSDANLASPDMFICQLEFSVTRKNGWTMCAGVAHPKSRGVVRLSGPDAADPAVIEANTLSHPDDLKTAVEAIALSRELGNSSMFEGLVKRELLPGKLERREMETFAREAAPTY